MHISCPWKLSTFQDPHPPCPTTSKILPPSWLWTSNFKRTTLHLQMITNQLKENIIHGWLSYVIRSFLKVVFCFQYQLFSLVWLSIDFFPFRWKQPRPQSYSEKLKTSSSLSSCSKKMCWSQGWVETSLSTFSWLHILKCAVV